MHDRFDLVWAAIFAICAAWELVRHEEWIRGAVEMLDKECGPSLEHEPMARAAHMALIIVFAWIAAWLAFG